MKSALFAATLALAAFGAREATAADAKIITEFTVQNLTEILTEMGGTEITPVTDPSGTTTVVVKFQGEPTSFTMIGCTAGQTCRDLQMWILFEADADRYTADFANGFNGTWLDVTAYARKDKSLMLRSLLISNGGLTREHIIETFKLLLNAPNLLVEYVQARGQIAMKPGDTKTLSLKKDVRGFYEPTANAPMRRSPKF